MIAYLWPIVLIIAANTVYQICAKEVPQGMSALASLTITYAVGAVLSFILYYLTDKNANILHEYAKSNWAPFALGAVVVCLEAGYIYAYKAGWPVSTAQIVQAAVVAAALIVVGALLYHEAMTWNRLLGIVVCLAGLVLINLK